MQNKLNPNLFILFVSNPLESADFYQQLLLQEPSQKSSTFALFDFKNGIQLGLWSNKTAEPKVTHEPASSEICFKEDNIDDVYKMWLKMGISMAQSPTDMDFGRTFVALDPDGHRIRVYKLREDSNA